MINISSKVPGQILEQGIREIDQAYLNQNIQPQGIIVICQTNAGIHTAARNFKGSLDALAIQELAANFAEVVRERFGPKGAVLLFEKGNEHLGSFPDNG